MKIQVTVTKRKARGIVWCDWRLRISATEGDLFRLKRHALETFGENVSIAVVERTHEMVIGITTSERVGHAADIGRFFSEFPKAVLGE